MTIRAMTAEYVLSILTKEGLLGREQAVEALRQVHQIQRKKSVRPKDRPAGHAGPEHGLQVVSQIAAMNLLLPGQDDRAVDEEIIMKAVAKDVGLPYRKIDHLELDLDVVTKILPRSFAAKHLIVPVGLADGVLEVAICDPFHTEVLDDVRRVADYRVTPVIATKKDVEKLIGEFYGFKTSIIGAQGQLAGPLVDLGNLEQYLRLKSPTEFQANDQHVKNAVDYLFSYAFDQRASDIHMEPKRNDCLIRMRIDGVLHNIHRLPKVIHPALVSRIKTVSRLDIAEKRRPQDGRIKIDHQGHEIEIRVSTIPVAFGEKVVMRILDPDILFRDLGQLFVSPEDLEKFETFLRQPHGIILVTGPTGSGKSTTLYSSLRRLSNEGVNITTIEDPIEMVVEEFNQIAVQPQAGISFGSILRNVLRQDPDIIMVGEMRDRETTDNAIQAALTGHLVLSTLHTNDAPSAITRLIDLGAEPFLVASTILGVIAQRLLRRVCRYCSEEYQQSPEELAAVGISIKDQGPVKLRRGQGCERCRNTGYLGRLATLEVMPYTDRLRQMTLSGAEAKAIKKAAQEEGMRTLRENAINIMIEGHTTFQEVLRVTGED